jgi:hypothetical protein
MTETVNTQDEGEESESERLERKGYSVKIREAVTFSQIFSQIEFFMEYKINLAGRSFYRGYMG